MSGWSRWLKTPGGLVAVQRVGFVGASSRALLSATATLSATAAALRSGGSVPLSAVASLTPLTSPPLSGAVALSASAGMSTAAARVKAGAGSLVAASTLGTAADRLRASAASLSSAATFTAAGVRTRNGAVSLKTTETLTATAVLKRLTMPSTVGTRYTMTDDASSTLPATTPSFTPAVGEVIVVKCVGVVSAFIAPTGTNLTFIQQVTSGGGTAQTIWTAVVSTAAPTTVTFGGSTTTGYHSGVVQRWQNATVGAATPVIGSGGSGAPSATITTTARNSVITWADGDKNAINNGRTYRTTSGTPVEEYVDLIGSELAYVAYYLYQPAAVAGVQTVGMTFPDTQNWSLVGIELAGVPV